jgi:hypothetical protein
MEKRRPSGVTVVAILAIINGTILVVGGVVAIYFVPNIITSQINYTLSNATDVNGLNVEFGPAMTSAIITIVYIVGSVTIALGLAWFGLAWGLFTGKGWAWLITVILAIISVVFSVIGIGTASVTSIPTLIINGVILYYMFRPNIKSYFGRVTIPK